VLKTPWFPPKDFHRLASRGASGSGLGRGESLSALVARFDKVLLLSKALVLAAYLGGWFHHPPPKKRGGNGSIPILTIYLFFSTGLGVKFNHPTISSFVAHVFAIPNVQFGKNHRF